MVLEHRLYIAWTGNTSYRQARADSFDPGGGVTGQVFNSTASFNGNRFLFVSENGSVPVAPGMGTTGIAETIAPASTDNIYKGAAIGSVAGQDYLYAANFKAGTVDVYKGTASAPALAGSFTDQPFPGICSFNIQNLNGSLYVTYALQDAAKGVMKSQAWDRVLSIDMT